MLLDHNAEVDAKITGDKAPLHLACMAEIVREKVVRSLLRAGANEAARIPCGQTPEDMLYIGNDGARRLLRRASEHHFDICLLILRKRVVAKVAGFELKRLRRTSSRPPAGRAAGAVLFLVNVASDDVFGKVVSFL